MKKYQKGFTPILALVLVAAVGFVLFYIYKNFGVQNLSIAVHTSSPTATISVDTKDWKTYTNKEANYSVMYPPNYTLPDERDIFALLSPPNQDNGRGYELQDGELKVEIGYEPFTGTPEEFVQQQVKNYDQQSGTLNIKTTALNGIPAVYYQTSEGEGEFYVLFGSNRKYSIAKYPSVTSRQNEFETILSTFKFTN